MMRGTYQVIHNNECIKEAQKSKVSSYDMLKEVKNSGAVSFSAGVKVGDNPYPADDDRHWAWMQGFVTAGLAKKRKILTDYQPQQ